MLNDQEVLEEVVASTARLLQRQDHMTEASLVTHSRISVRQGDSRGLDFCLWLVWFHLPIDVYTGLEDRGAIGQTIERAMDEVIDSVDTDSRVEVSIKIDTKLEYHKDWRREIAQILSGETVSNQGRVQSTNVATIQENGLLFRSEPEVMFYRAAKRRGIVFAPLPVFLRGGPPPYCRREPDFVVIKDGITLIVELDGRRYHRELPAEAQQKLAFMTDQGAEMHRIEASNCLTDEDATRCVTEVIAKIDRIKKNRR
jgi:hypothetical protein